MTRPFHLLEDAANAMSSSQTLDPDQVFIVAALLCILICMLGLVIAEQCTWICRLSSSPSSTATSTGPPQHQIYSSEAANKGIKKKTLCSLPKLTFSSCSSTERKFSDCTICLTEFVSGDELRMLPQCGHTFHVACINMWLGSHSSCPSCRRILVASSLLVMDRNKSHSRCAKCSNFQATSISITSSNSSTSV